MPGAGRWCRALRFVTRPRCRWVPRARGAAAPCPCARAERFRAGCGGARGRIALALFAFLSGPLQEFRLRAVNPAPCASKSRKNQAERTGCLSCASWSVAAGARPARTFCIVLHIASPVPLGTRALRCCGSVRVSGRIFYKSHAAAGGARGCCLLWARAQDPPRRAACPGC